MRIRITAYAGNSQSATAINSALNELLAEEELPVCKRTLMRGSTYVAAADDFIINWGTRTGNRSNIMEMSTARVINNTCSVEIASNKYTALCTLSRAGVTVCPFTAEKRRAETWQNMNSSVVCRSTLRGSGGRGITIVLPRDDLPIVPLYTMYIPKQHEYRVHVLGGAVHVRQKRRRLSEDDPNWEIRNHENGFIMAQECSYMPVRIEELAKDAVKALGLDFGAVDIIYNEDDDTCYVLEVNTAPGLEGGTVDLYADYFLGLIKEYVKEEESVEAVRVEVRGASQISLHSSAGEVCFTVQQLPGNCGISLICYVQWRPRTYTSTCAAALEKVLSDYICADYSERNWDDIGEVTRALNHSTLMVTDAAWGEEGGEENPSLWGMCVRGDQKWEQSNATYNVNSSNQISVFTHCRPKGTYSEI